MQEHTLLMNVQGKFLGRPNPNSSSTKVNDETLTVVPSKAFMAVNVYSKRSQVLSPGSFQLREPFVLK